MTASNNIHYSKDFSVIIPVWRGAIRFLPKLLDSIPLKEGVEIIVVDNSEMPVGYEEINSSRDFILLHSAPERHAGGSRNDGMAVAHGKWLLFADADDYYTAEAFDTFYSKLNTDAEIVYTGMGGVYEDTGELSDRGDRYARLVHQYCIGEVDEYDLRLGFASPCCKMVSHALVDRHELRYDEIRAGNDVFFSLLSGYYAKKISAVDKITYIATVNHGSLTKRCDYEVVKARLYSRLRCNQFLKKHGFAKRQSSIMVYLYEGRYFGLGKLLQLIRMVVEYKQNPFIGWSRWKKSFVKKKKNDTKDKRFIVKEQ